MLDCIPGSAVYMTSWQFREYLESNGYDTSQMGLPEAETETSWSDGGSDEKHADGVDEKVTEV